MDKEDLKEAQRLMKKDSGAQEKLDFDSEVEEVDLETAGGELPDDEQQYFDGQAHELRSKGL